MPGDSEGGLRIRQAFCARSTSATSPGRDSFRWSSPAMRHASMTGQTVKFTLREIKAKYPAPRPKCGPSGALALRSVWFDEKWALPVRTGGVRVWHRHATDMAPFWCTRQRFGMQACHRVAIALWLRRRDCDRAGAASCWCGGDQPEAFPRPDGSGIRVQRHRIRAANPATTRSAQIMLAIRREDDGGLAIGAHQDGELLPGPDFHSVRVQGRRCGIALPHAAAAHGGDIRVGRCSQGKPAASGIEPDDGEDFGGSGCCGVTAQRHRFWPANAAAVHCCDVMAVGGLDCLLQRGLRLGWHWRQDWHQDWCCKACGPCKAVEGANTACDASHDLLPMLEC